MKPTEQLSLSPELAPVEHKTSALAPINILEAAIRGGVTKENVDVVKELVQMCREQRSEDAKAAFSAAYFQLRKNMPSISADREAKDRSGNVVYVYCSEEEITKMLEPHLMAYGFAMLFGQSENNGRITVSVTLIHEHGHQETREYTVRAGTPNAMKDGAMCDAGGATTAWRHLMIKMFGLKSRIQENQDARNDGEKISAEKVAYLIEQCQELGGNAEEKIMEVAGVTNFRDVGEQVYPVLSRLIEGRKAAKRGKTS